MCYNAVDRHVSEGRGDQTAIIYDSPVTGTIQHISYKELLTEVKLFWVQFEQNTSQICPIIYILCDKQ